MVDGLPPRRGHAGRKVRYSRHLAVAHGAGNVNAQVEAAAGLRGLGEGPLEGGVQCVHHLTHRLPAVLSPDAPAAPVGQQGDSTPKGWTRLR